MSAHDDWDVVIVGAGPAGLTAARVAASSGARTLVLERAHHPRYKTCGGGLLGGSLQLVQPHIDVPVRDRIDTVVFTHDGRREIRRHSDGTPILAMVRRDEFDDALRAAAERAGAVLWQGCAVRAVRQDQTRAYARLADGREPAGRLLIGADGSAGVTARHVGASFHQVDLGLEVEIEVPDPVAAHWAGRLLIDWGPIPGSYAWVFPKGPILTVGVIAARGQGEDTRRYLRRFVDRLDLARYPVLHDSGHLTRCCDTDSPLGRGRILLAGDAAGLLEPWTREGISFALRSGAAAGAAAVEPGPALDRYAEAIRRDLQPEMVAGRRLLTAFTRHPGVFHAVLATPPGWRMFHRFCRGETAFAPTVQRRPVRAALAVLGAR